tara:strand:- start:520 stop:945 length:426 start_codon:yes stop_codon:yes gene_type:complete
MLTAIILRGLPGSGKSTVAEILALGRSTMVSHDSNTITHSTDSFFYEDGDYNFDFKKLGEYHAKNLAAFTDSCEKKVSLIICDNTNTQYWEYEKYIEAAKKHGYKVHIVTVGDFDVECCAERNTHGVPGEAIQKMKDRWEL